MKINILMVVTSLALISTSFARHTLSKNIASGPDPQHGGNEDHVVCTGVIPAPTDENHPSQKIAILIDSERDGSNNWFNVVRGVYGLEDYIGKAALNPNAEVTVANTLTSTMASDFLFKGKIDTLDGSAVHLVGQIKVAPSDPNQNSQAPTTKSIDATFPCVDVTPFSIEGAKAQAGQ